MLFGLQLLGLRLTDGRVSLYADRTLRRVFFHPSLHPSLKWIDAPLTSCHTRNKTLNISSHIEKESNHFP